jgi:hypothetical protein
VLLMAQQMTVNDSLARHVLKYRPVLSRQAGLSELAGEVLPAEPARSSVVPLAHSQVSRKASAAQDGAPAQPTR